MNNNVVAHCKQGTSDKVYMIGVYPEKLSNGESEFVVKVRYGRRGNVNQETIKARRASIDLARADMNKLIGTKIKKGYVDIESSSYTGTMTLDEVDGILAPEGDAFDPDDILNVTQNAVNSVVEDDFDGEDVEAVCLDNVGMEDKFLVGVAYMVESHDNAKLVYVIDRFGESQECYKERFQVVR
jgi:predicted DNA-binding WGR domain protein